MTDTADLEKRLKAFASALANAPAYSASSDEIHMVRGAAATINALTRKLEEAYEADRQKTREWNIMAQENRELAGQIEVLGDERFDAGYQMAIEHCVRICRIAADEGLGIYTIMARIGQRAPDPSRLSRADADVVTDQGEK